MSIILTSVDVDNFDTYNEVNSGVTVMIGKKLKVLRELKKLKQSDIAEMLGVSRTTYTQYETEKSEPDLKTVLKLAKFFSVSVDQLLLLGEPEPITAYHGNNEFTEEELEDIEQFKEFVKMRREQKKDQ